MGHCADVAALLVDHDQRAPVARLLDGAGQPPPRSRTAAVRAEQDDAGRFPGSQAAPDVLGPRGAREARDGDLPDLLAEREAVDRLARGGEPLLLRGLDGRRLAVSAGVIAGAGGKTGNEGDECAGAQGGEPPAADRSAPRRRPSPRPHLRAIPGWAICVAHSATFTAHLADHPSMPSFSERRRRPGPWAERGTPRPPPRCRPPRSPPRADPTRRPRPARARRSPSGRLSPPARRPRPACGR